MPESDSLVIIRVKVALVF